MAHTPSQKTTREWPLLILAVTLVCTLCIPLWQWSANNQPADPNQPLTTAQRVGTLLLGPEQIACYCCVTWAGFILLGRYLEVRRQQRAFGLHLLPTEVGVCILPEDARLLQRKVEQTAAPGGSCWPGCTACGRSPRRACAARGGRPPARCVPPPRWAKAPARRRGAGGATRGSGCR